MIDTINYICKAQVKKTKKWTIGYLIPIYGGFNAAYNEMGLIKSAFDLKFFIKNNKDSDSDRSNNNNNNNSDRSNNNNKSNINYSDIEIINPETICRYTGLVDSNAVMIFENAIVKSKEGYKGIVKFGNYDDHYGFYIEWIDNIAKYWKKDILYYLENDELKVVGNG